MAAVMVASGEEVGDEKAGRFRDHLGECAKSCQRTGWKKRRQTKHLVNLISYLISID